MSLADAVSTATAFALTAGRLRAARVQMRSKPAIAVVSRHEQIQSSSGTYRCC
jgi:hypothetical protein